MTARLLIISILVSSLLAPPSDGSDAPTRVVEGLHSTLITVMKEAEKLRYDGRYDFLSPVIKAGFDLPYIARIVVGRYWRNFNDEEKTRFVKAFSRLSIATYAGRFDGYSGERFKVVTTKPLKKGRIMVRTVLIKKDGEEIKLDYILHERENKWRIINVIARGVSDLALKRSDYTAFLKKNDFNAFIDKLHEKIKLFTK